MPPLSLRYRKRRAAAARRQAPANIFYNAKTNFNNNGSLSQNIKLGNNSNIHSILRTKDPNWLVHQSPTTLGGIAKSYGLSGKARSMFIGIMLISARIVNGQTVPATLTKNTLSGNSKVSIYNQNKSSFVPRPEDVQNSLQSALVSISSSTSSEKFSCSYKTSNAEWKAASRAKNWMGRNTSEQELNRLRRAQETACNAEREQKSKEVIVIGETAGKAIASVYTHGQEELTRAQLKNLQTRANAEAERALRAEKAAANAKAALNKAQEKHARNLVEERAKAKNEAEKAAIARQAAIEAEKFRKSLAGRLARAKGAFLGGLANVGGAAGETLGSTAGIFSTTARWLKGSIPVIVVTAVSAALLAGVGFVNFWTGGSIRRALKLIKDISKSTKSESAETTARRLASNIKEAVPMNSPPRAANQRQSPRVANQRQSPRAANQSPPKRLTVFKFSSPNNNAARRQARARRFA